MKGHQTRRAVTGKSGIGGHRKRGEHPVLELQRRAGNRAVAPLVEMNVQRKGEVQRESKGGSAPATTDPAKSLSPAPSKTSPDFLGSYIRAVESARAGDRTTAGEELRLARLNVSALMDEASSDVSADVATSLLQAGNIMLRYSREIQPRPLEKVADKMQEELEQVTKISQRVTQESLKDFIE